MKSSEFLNEDKDKKVWLAVKRDEEEIEADMHDSFTSYDGIWYYYAPKSIVKNLGNMVKQWKTDPDWDNEEIRDVIYGFGPNTLRDFGQWEHSEMTPKVWKKNKVKPPKNVWLLDLDTNNPSLSKQSY